MPERNNTKPPYSLVEMLRLIPRSSLPIGVAWNKCEEAADLIETQAARIAEQEAAIYQYVNHVVSYEGISFIDEMNEPPWAKLINDTWVKQAALEGGGKKDE